MHDTTRSEANKVQVSEGRYGFWVYSGDFLSLTLLNLLFVEVPF